MAFRDVRVFRVRELLRLWLRGEGIRPVSRMVGMGRKTVRRYVDAADELDIALTVPRCWPCGPWWCAPTPAW